MTACAAVSLGLAQGVYQIPNSDFEGEWTTNEIKGLLGSISHSEDTPASWHSFYHADGEYKDAAVSLFANQAGTVKQTTGYDGKGFSAAIVSRKNMMESISNGNLTTGIVHMGSMTADDPQNYNYSNVNSADSCCLFTGLPDSVKVWFKFKPKTETDEASMNLILHTEGGYRDPSASLTEEEEAAARIAKAYTTIGNTGEQWKAYSVAFDYNGDLYQTYEGKKYMLASFSTNKGAGKGSADDSLFIDHIQLVYNSELAGLSYDGQSVFSEGQANYDLSDKNYDESKLEATANGKGATIEKAYDEETGILTLTVKGNDISEAPENLHVYTVQFKTESASTTDKEYTDNLTVTINGVTTPEQTTTITVNTTEEGKMNIVLPNFTLIMGGSPLYVGTIKVNDIPLTGSGSYQTFSTEQTIQIEAGDLTDVPENVWAGPNLGNVPLKMTGKMSDDKFYTTLDIYMELLKQNIHVVFGTDNFGTSVQGIQAAGENSNVNVYTLQGVLIKSNVTKAQALDGLQKGIYIVGDKKVVKK